MSVRAFGVRLPPKLNGTSRLTKAKARLKPLPRLQRSVVYAGTGTHWQPHPPSHWPPGGSVHGLLKTEKHLADSVQDNTGAGFKETESNILLSVSLQAENCLLDSLHKTEPEDHSVWALEAKGKRGKPGYPPINAGSMMVGGTWLHPALSSGGPQDMGLLWEKSASAQAAGGRWGKASCLDCWGEPRCTLRP